MIEFCFNIICGRAQSSKTQLKHTSVLCYILQVCDIDKNNISTFSVILWIRIRQILQSVILCYYLKDYCGQLKDFDILHILCGGQFTLIEMYLFQ